MNWRVWENPWRLMPVVNVAVVIGVLLHKITLPPFVPYIHLLVDYHFGLTKRALIGALVALFTAKVPIATIVLLRYYLVQALTRSNLVVGIAAVLTIGLLFVTAQFFGTVEVPPAEFVTHLQNRVADPSREDLLRNAHAFAYIWYQPLSHEIRDTWDRMPSNLLGVPVFALLIWLHKPLWRYFADLIRALSSEIHRRIVIAAIILVSAACLIMFAMVFDYSRWISNWAVCLFLILHAVKTLPAAKDVPLIPVDDWRTTIFGWIVTVIPRVGITRPF
jgi:hypothetical protein